MKNKIILGLAILIVSLLALGVFATELNSTLSFGVIPEENMEAYSLNFVDQDIKIGNILTKQLIFLNKEENAGFFYMKNNELKSFPGQFSFISPRINEIKYNLMHFTSLSDLLTDEQLIAFGVEEQGFFSLVTELDSKSIRVNDVLIDALILPDDGSKLITVSNGNFGAKELPVNLKFKEGSSESENLQDVAGGEAEIQEGEIGCIDHDDVDNVNNQQINMNLEQNTPSFVSYIFKKNEELISLTIPDFCAELGQGQGRTLSKLYEADCGADGLPTYKEVNCNCKNGACEVDNGRVIKFCVDTDPLVYDEPSEERLENPEEGITPSQGFTNTFKVKGTTVGYYSISEGKEFGVWEDYCADEKTLVEYYCINDETTMFRTVICPSGCSNGKCVGWPYCFETDGGKTIEVKGRTKAINAQGGYLNEVDECVNKNTLKEYYCDKTNIRTGFNFEDIACGDGKECSEGKCIDAQGCTTDDDCIDEQSCIGGVCAHGYVTHCIVDQECPEGYECNLEEQCVLIEEEPVMELQKCSSCISERPYDVSVWEGENCAIDEIKNREEILSCQKGSYCIENGKLGTQCVLEPLDSWSQIYDAFSRIFIWANWLNKIIPVPIGEDQEAASGGRFWQAGMNSVADGLSQVDNAINAESSQNLADLANEQDGGITFCNENIDCGPNEICEIIRDTEPEYQPDNNGICRARSEPNPTQKIGDFCLNDAECIDGICQNQSCRCSHEGESLGCQSSETYCLSIGSQCVDKKEGLGDCSHNYECLNNLCTDDVCSIYCNSNAHCASDERCNIEREITCPYNMPNCGTCMPRPPEPEQPKKAGGATCSDNTECLSNNCLNGKCTCNVLGPASCGTGKYCPSTGSGSQCVDKKMEGLPCTANYECLNNQCISGQCKSEYDVGDGYNIN